MKRTRAKRAAEDWGDEEDPEDEEDYDEEGDGSSRPGLIFAMPAEGQGTPKQAAALRLVKRTWPDYEIVGPYPNWDKIYTPVGARSLVMGYAVVVLVPWRGHWSRGLSWIADVAPRVVTVWGRVFVLEDGEFYKRWKTEAIPKERRTRSTWERVSVVEQSRRQRPGAS